MHESDRDQRQVWVVGGKPIRKPGEAAEAQENEIDGSDDSKTLYRLDRLDSLSRCRLHHADCGGADTEFSTHGSLPLSFSLLSRNRATHDRLWGWEGGGMECSYPIIKNTTERTLSALDN